MSVLLVHSSSRIAGSFSREYAERLANGLAGEGGAVVTRDLLATSVPHLSSAMVFAIFTPDEALTEADRAELALSDELIAELLAADTIVIGVPTYNFTIPSSLKAWIDHVARRGKTFRYKDNAPVGLAAGRTAYLVRTTGGIEIDGPMDFATSYLKAILGFIGITDMHVLAIGKLAFGDEAVAASRAAAEAVISEMVVAGHPHMS
ncbi:MAG: NAD(P)H-dependent oxidoreductase [Sphingomonadaceae bacterium]|nr:NAD(P)H-dependent oxidoreductase [Sphingomonadaceae bacterium]